MHPENATILFIVNPEERNIVDQRGIEYSIWEQFKIPVAYHFRVIYIQNTIY